MRLLARLAPRGVSVAASATAWRIRRSECQETDPPTASPLWPWLAGGIVLASGAGVAAYYTLTTSRPTAEESVELALKCISDGDVEAARAHFRCAADQGDAIGQSNLACTLYEGIGGPVDHEQAREYYRRAAENGNTEAQSSYGDMLALGEGGAVDTQEARKWYQRAADQGDAYGAYSFAEFLFEGSGGPKDVAAAKKYWEMAAAHGHEEAKKRLRAEFGA